MKQFVCCFVLVLLPIAAAAQTVKSSPGKTNAAAVEQQKSAPVLTDQQKATVKDFQLTDSNLEVDILRAQKQQQDNQARANAYISGLCITPEGKYFLDLQSLTCKPLPTKAEVSITK